MENSCVTIDKSIISKNIKILVESEFYCNEYCKLINKQFRGLENISNPEFMENASAKVFNAILFACQATDDLQVALKFASEILNNNCFYEEGLINSELSDFYADTLSKNDPYYKTDSIYKLNHRLKHGFAVHFTTPNIADKIQKNGVFSSTNKMFSPELENKIIKINEYFNSLKNYHMLSGFGFSKGISMGAQTVGFYKERTPESLYMLFGGQTCTRNKQKAMDYIEKVLEEVPKELRQDVYHELDRVWDELIGNSPMQTAILIDRDQLVYSYGEKRPYENISYNFLSMDLINIEESRYNKDISSDALHFISVPMLPLLNKYYVERYTANLSETSELTQQNELNKPKTRVRTLNGNVVNNNGFINILAIVTLSILLLSTLILIFNFVNM